MLKLRKNKKGFTLVELIVVIAIMAVLAGTVAGVTVSQLNKRTDEANHTQAKKIADTIYEELLASVEVGVKKADMTSAVTDAYGSSVIFTGTPTAGKQFLVTIPEDTVAVDSREYTVEYKGKQGAKGNIKYKITATGGVVKDNA